MFFVIVMHPGSSCDATYDIRMLCGDRVCVQLWSLLHVAVVMLQNVLFVLTRVK